ncbi:hypothetical protein D3C80_890340 [compost metagenome]
MSCMQIPLVIVLDDRPAEDDTLDLDICEARQNVADYVGAEAVRNDHDSSCRLHCLGISELLHNMIDRR